MTSRNIAVKRLMSLLINMDDFQN